MIQNILWGVTFVTLWLTIVWLNFLTAENPKRRWKSWPKVTFGIPAYNEEGTIVKTVRSLLDADYPAAKKEIIVVDDGSSDRTTQKLREFIKAHPGVPVQVFRKKNGGKSSALNVALKHATGDFFAVMDADSRITPGSVKRSLAGFTGDKVGAVISRVRVDEPKNVLEKLQYFEYIMSNMFRRIMCNFGTLSITPGVLSLYRTNLVRELGGFTSDPDNLTEDLEIAMRLKYKGYSIEMEEESVTYTHVPQTLSELWRQRIRWARGYIYNHWKYRSMFFSRKHGVFGVFQMPVNVVAVLLLVLNIGIIAFDVFNRLFDFVFRSLTIPNYFVNRLFDWPTVKQFVLAKNVQVILPIMVAFVLGVYLIMFAHRLFGERLRNHVGSLVGYTIMMPYFATLNWVASIAQEVSRSKRKW